MMNITIEVAIIGLLLQVFSILMYACYKYYKWWKLEKEHKLYVGKICVLRVNNLKINTEIEKIEYPVVRFKFISTSYIVYDIEKYYSNGKAMLELEWNDGTIEIKEISMV